MRAVCMAGLLMGALAASAMAEAPPPGAPTVPGDVKIEYTAKRDGEKVKHSGKVTFANGWSANNTTVSIRKVNTTWGGVDEYITATLNADGTFATEETVGGPPDMEDHDYTPSIIVWKAPFTTTFTVVGPRQTVKLPK